MQEKKARVIVRKDEMSEVANGLALKLAELPIMLFEGNLGAGKTTLVKLILKELGVSESVASPTFSIVNIFETENGEEIYHFDCYRLKNEIEALDIGIEENLDSGNICLIEWPNVIESLIIGPHWKVEIGHHNADSRYISISKVEL